MKIKLEWKQIEKSWVVLTVTFIFLESRVGVNELIISQGFKPVSGFGTAFSWLVFQGPCVF